MAEEFETLFQIRRGREEHFLLKFFGKRKIASLTEDLGKAVDYVLAWVDSHSLPPIESPNGCHSFRWGPKEAALL